MKKELLDIIKRSYPKGTRVVLEHKLAMGENKTMHGGGGGQISTPI